MKSAAWLIWLAGAAVLLVVLAQDGLPRSMPVAEAAEAAAGWKPLPPLKVDKTAPLLLLKKPTPKAADNAGARADNSACFCCHGNYQDEPLVAVHAIEKIGCNECHGDSFAHRGDEGNVTPPDKMYWPERIGPMCRQCHETHNAPPQKVIARWRECCAAIGRPDEIVCTDCHGQHRLPSRTVVWDKRTGKLAGRNRCKSTNTTSAH
jgi:hypothetical protein